MDLIIGLLNKLIAHLQKKAYRKLIHKFGNPKKWQEKSLAKILKRGNQTEIAKELGIDGVTDRESFQKKCPITNYETYRTICKDMYNNNNSDGRMAKKKCDYFVMTSGTTSEPKYIPIQDDYREEYMRIFLPWLGCIRTNRPKALSGKTLYLADVALVGTSPTGKMCGVMSGYNFRKVPSLIRRHIYASHENFYDLADKKKTTITLLAHAINSDLTLLGTIMPETIMMFLDNIFVYHKEILSYLENGVPPFDCPKAYEKSMKLTPSQEIIERFKAVVTKGHLESIHEIFPQLDTIVSWKSSTAKFYIERLEGILPENVVIWDGVYSASEGWFNFPLHYSEVGGPCAIDGHFLEFIEIGDETQKFKGVWELEEGKEYELFLTTSMGLYRYQMFDKVRVTGFFKKTPKIEFIEKTGEFLALAMERITTGHVQEFVDVILEQLGSHYSEIQYFTLSPCYKGSLPHYTLLLETDINPDRFKTIDATKIMSKINPNFKRCIDGKLLGQIKIATLKPGHIKNILKEREKKGQSIAQFKYSPIEKDSSITKEVCPCND